MLDVQDMHAYYGKSHILQGVNLRVNKGEIVALLGRNGVGRSTTCKAIMGEVPPKGIVRFNGEDIAGKPAFEVANLGIGYV
ncbi:MAG: ATP-binding cassette domain-containing protein, partial [Rhodobacteraceae bacterium]|nr:ATP-binding cassette domain-containing protein [Paracoccaceae bacterium]